MAPPTKPLKIRHWVRHSYHEANMCVGALANLGCSLNADICWCESCLT